MKLKPKALAFFEHSNQATVPRFFFITPPQGHRWINNKLQSNIL